MASRVFCFKARDEIPLISSTLPQLPFPLRLACAKGAAAVIPCRLNMPQASAARNSKKAAEYFMIDAMSQDIAIFVLKLKNQIGAQCKRVRFGKEKQERLF